MTANIPVQSPFLRTSRNFPTDIQPLVIEINRAYNDIALRLNARTIGTFPLGQSIVTGEEWFITGPKQQTLRQLYTFTSAGNISHGINLSTISGITKIYGTFTDGTNWYPLPLVNTVNVTNQISISVGPSNIVIIAGGGAPSITYGYIILEYLANP